MANTYKRFNITLNDDRYDMCEHLKMGMVAPVVYCEDDTFGPVMRYAVCQACYDASQEEECQCENCGRMVKTRQLRQWRPYDFYAPQGDVPLELCDICWDEPEHAQRIAENRRRAREELERDYEGDVLTVVNRTSCRAVSDDEELDDYTPYINETLDMIEREATELELLRQESENK